MAVCGIRPWPNCVEKAPEVWPCERMHGQNVQDSTIRLDLVALVCLIEPGLALHVSWPGGGGSGAGKSM